MNYLILFLQSILEFLPVSSSIFLTIIGHCELDKLEFLHFTTGISGILFFYKDIYNFLYSKKKMLFFIIVGISSVLFLLALKFFGIPKLDNFYKIILNAIMALVLLLAYFKKSNREFDFSPFTGLLFGITIVASLFLGISRLGSLLVVSLVSSYNVKESYKIILITSSMCNIGFLALNLSNAKYILCESIDGMFFIPISLLTIYVVMKNIKYSIFISIIMRLMLFLYFVLIN